MQVGAPPAGATRSVFLGLPCQLAGWRLAAHGRAGANPASGSGIRASGGQRASWAFAFAGTCLEASSEPEQDANGSRNPESRRRAGKAHGLSCRLSQRVPCPVASLPLATTRAERRECPVHARGEENRRGQARPADHRFLAPVLRGQARAALPPVAVPHPAYQRCLTPLIRPGSLACANPRQQELACSLHVPDDQNRPNR